MEFIGSTVKNVDQRKRRTNKMEVTYFNMYISQKLIRIRFCAGIILIESNWEQSLSCDVSSVDLSPSIDIIVIVIIDQYYRHCNNVATRSKCHAVFTLADESSCHVICRDCRQQLFSHFLTGACERPVISKEIQKQLSASK